MFPPANVVPALLYRLAFDQVYLAPQNTLQRLFHFQGVLKPRVCVRTKFHQEIGVAAGWVEIHAARGRAEDLQLPDVITTAKCGNVSALFLYQRVHRVVLRVIKQLLAYILPVPSAHRTSASHSMALSCSNEGLKQLGHLVLRQPDRLVLQADLHPSLAVAGSVEEKPGLGFVARRSLPRSG